LLNTSNSSILKKRAARRKLAGYLKRTKKSST
jgi:hypothetical protein